MKNDCNQELVCVSQKKSFQNHYLGLSQSSAILKSTSHSKPFKQPFLLNNTKSKVPWNSKFCGFAWEDDLDSVKYISSGCVRVAGQTGPGRGSSAEAHGGRALPSRLAHFVKVVVGLQIEMHWWSFVFYKKLNYLQ